MNKLLLNSIIQAVVMIVVFTAFFLTMGAHWLMALLIGVAIYVLIALLFHALTLPFYILARVRGAVYVPSADDRIVDMLALAKVKKGTKVMDLGSGDGRVMVAFAKAGAIVDGCEINPMLVRRSRQVIEEAGVSDRCTVYWQSLWDISFAKYDVIVVYGIPYIMEELGQKLRREVKPTAKILSNAFPFPNWKPKAQRGEIREYKVD